MDGTVNWEVQRSSLGLNANVQMDDAGGGGDGDGEVTGSDCDGDDWIQTSIGCLIDDEKNGYWMPWDYQKLLMSIGCWLWGQLRWVQVDEDSRAFCGLQPVSVGQVSFENIGYD